jgi:hypothetical protein
MKGLILNLVQRLADPKVKGEMFRGTQVEEVSGRWIANQVKLRA